MKKVRSYMLLKQKQESLLAVILFFLLASVFLLAAFFRETTGDEYVYYTLAEMICQGDRLMVDIWHPVQLFSIFLILPYRAFTLFSGSNEGIILFMRLLYVAAVLALYWYYYKRFRGLSRLSSVMSALFCVDVFAGMIALNYYNIALHCTAVCCCELFFAEKCRPIRLILIGILFSCAVICEPGLAAVYGLFSSLVLISFIRHRKGKAPLFRTFPFLENGRYWLWSTLGVLISAAVFSALLLYFSGLRSIVENLPHVFSSNQYSITAEGDFGRLSKLRDLFDGVGGIANVVLLALNAAAFLIVKKKKGNVSLRLKEAVLVPSVVAALCSAADCDWRSSALVLGLLCPIFYMFCGNRDSRVFAFWITGAVCSVAVDVFSTVTLFSFFRLAYFPLLLHFGRIFTEARQPASTEITDDAAKRRRNRSFRNMFSVFAVLAVSVVSLTSAAVLPLTTLSLPNEFFHAEIISAGPDKGLLSSEKNAAYINRLIADFDVIAKKTPGPVYIANRMTFGYLYLGFPVATYSIEYDLLEHRAFLRQFYALHPEKLPKYIYYPNDTDLKDWDYLPELVQGRSYRQQTLQNGRLYICDDSVAQ